MLPFYIRTKDVHHHFQLFIVVVFQLLLISCHYHVISGFTNCDYALALARTIQPTTCQNIPQCDAKCLETVTAASIGCKSSKTYCNVDDTVCANFVTGGAYSDERFSGSGFIVTVQSWNMYFTKGFDNAVFRLLKGSATGTTVTINNIKCLVTIGSCGDKIDIDCTNINGGGWFQGCTNKFSTGTVLGYFFSIDVIDPCNKVPVAPTVAAPTLPAPTPPTLPAPPTSPTLPAPTAPTVPAPIPPTTNPNESPATCFSSSNTVYVNDVGLIPINQLQIGDMVQSDHFGTYTQVYGFGHYDHDTETDYTRFFMTNNDMNDKDLNPLEISSHHYIYILSRENDDAKNNTEKEMMHMNDMITIRASDVVVDDKIWNGHQYQTIQSIQYVKRHGIYAPLTQSGHLIVSNVMVSNYVHLLNDHINSYLLWNQHDIGHIFFFPHRYYCRHNINECKKESYYNGYSYWAYHIVRVSSHMNQYNGLFIALLISFMSITMYITATIIETSFIVFGLVLCSVILMIVCMTMKRT